MTPADDFRAIARQMKAAQDGHGGWLHKVTLRGYHCASHLVSIMFLVASRMGLGALRGSSGP